MKKFILEFVGRTFPSEGIVYPIKETIDAENFEEANLKLYDKYEHIEQVKATTIIYSNGSKWGGEAPDTIEKLIEVLKTETIEERFFEKFSVQREKSIEWLNQCPISHENTCTQFFGNFEKLSHVFNIETTDINLILQLSEAIKKNKGWELYYQKHLVKK